MENLENNIEEVPANEVEVQTKENKFKAFFQKLGKRNLIIIGGVFLLAIAICLNFVLLGASDNSTITDNAGKEVSLNDSQENSVSTYFSATQVSRDRARDEALQVLQSVVDSAETESTVKTQALEDISTLAKCIESEANIEAMVKAKGIEECVAIINDDTCTVVVKTDGLKVNQMSQINEIVYNETGIKPVNIKYIEKN